MDGIEMHGFGRLVGEGRNVLFSCGDWKVCYVFQGGDELDVC
jgi:hypothetical protein